MAKDTLQEFFRAKKKKSQEEAKGTDWRRKKREWLRALDALYQHITHDYLAKAIADASVVPEYAPRTITEDFIGEYEVKDLILQVVDEKVTLSPKGTNVVGATGRVDLVGEMGTITLVLQSKGRWGVVVSRSPTLRIVPLDKPSLLDALKTVMRP
jgi:hypothetical protein